MKLRRIGACIALLALSGTIALLGPAALASQARPEASSPTASANPDANLIDLQIVHVSWQNFPPGLPVSFYQCIPAPASLKTDCFVKPQPFGQTSAPSDSNGAGIVPIQVHEGTFGTVTCDDQHACVVMLLAQGWKLGQAVLVPIGFSPPPTPCPPASGAGSVQAQGAPTAFRAMSVWSGAACNLTPSLSVDYTTSGSDDFTASDNFAAGSTDFAATSFPISSADQDALTKKHRGFQYAPITSGALVFAYNIYDQTTHQQVTNLKLPASVLAEIFTEQVFAWTCPPPPADCKSNGGDPLIQTDNPGVRFPPNVNAFVLAGSQGQTLEFTQWMTAVTPHIYTAGPQEVWADTHINPLGTVTPVTDPFDEGLAVAAPQSADFTQVGYIGVMDSSVAALNSLPTVQIQVNGSDSQYVTATPATVAAAVAAAKVNKDGVTIQPPYTTTDSSQYPLPLESYATVPTTLFSTKKPLPNTFDANDGKVLKAFLTYTISGTGQGTLPLGSWPLSNKEEAQAAAAIKKIPTSASSSSGDGSGSGDGTGTGTGVGTGSGTTIPTTPPPSPLPSTSASPTPSPTPIKYIAAGKDITSPRSSILVPILAVLAILGLLLGPALLVVDKVAPALSSSAKGVKARVTGSKGAGPPAPPATPG